MSTPDASGLVPGRLGILTPDDAVVRGFGADDLRAAERAGALVRVRTGAYVESSVWQELDDAGRYRLRVLAAARRLREPIFSHDSAAALWSLPRIGPWPDEVHVLVPGGSGGRSSPGVRRHVGARPRTVMALDGLRWTSVARTVVDVARAGTFVDGLVAADHAFREGRVTSDDLAAEAATTGSGRGARAARRVAAFATADSESVGESLSRARIIELGLPLPELQHPVHDNHGFVGRVDFWWPRLRLVGEFDGRIKYRTDGVQDRRAVEDRLWDEKRREDRLRALGLAVVRWTWDVAMDPRRFAARLARVGLRP